MMLITIWGVNAIINDNNYQMPTKTHMLLRRLRRIDAELFVKNGIIHFGKPGDWIEACKNGDNRIGDDCEGVFAAAENSEKELLAPIRPNVEIFYKGNIVYLRSKDIRSLPTLCFYGINDTSFNQRNKQYAWHTQDTGCIEYDFFSDVSNTITKDEYVKMKVEEQPVIVMIHKPNVFIDRIIIALKKRGIQEDEFLAGPVKYIDKSQAFVTDMSFPYELFLKDKSYHNQSEIRFVLNPHSKEIREELSKEKDTISIGNISDIAFVSDMYFSKMRFAKQDESTLIYELTEEIVSDMKTDFQSLVLYAILISQEFKLIRVSNIFDGIKKADELLFRYHGVHCYLELQDIEKMNYTLVFKGVSDEQNKIIQYVMENIQELIDQDFYGIST